MTDDMGYADLSIYGRKDYKTTQLDKLASEGMLFTQAYSAGPLCTPTRVGFMTGRYPARTPVGLLEPLTPIRADSAYGLTADYPSVAGLVRKAGYETILIGKWHLGFLPEHSPTKNGYDYFYGFHSGAADYISHKGDGRNFDLYENDEKKDTAGYLTDIFSAKAIKFLRSEHKKPFFLTLNYNAPHWPWQGRKDSAYRDNQRFTEGGNPAIYKEMMLALDEGVGSIMKALSDLGLDKNTVVIFTNDNGGERYSDHGGLSKHKSTLWEGGIRVPAFVRWPGKIKAGVVSAQPIITMDWTATILDLAGAKPHEDFALDGVSLIPHLTGKKNDFPRTFYWRSFQRYQEKAVRDGNWKYLQDSKGEYLFDLSVDQGEKTNLKDQQPAVFNELKNKMAAWEKTVLKPIPLAEAGNYKP